MTQDEPVRLLLAEDQVMIREALAALLSFEGDIEVVAQVGRGDEVLKAAEATRPDVAVLDIEMPGMDGLTAAAELKVPDRRVSWASSSSAMPAASSAFRAVMTSMASVGLR